MPRPRVAYSCTSCGAQVSRWEGRCPRCETWDSLVEIVAETASGRRTVGIRTAPEGVTLSAVTTDQHAPPRLTAAMPDTMRVLGGGLVPGSVTLLAGEPGIGKSTLLLQLACSIGAGANRVVYAAGEESPTQIGLRARRLGITSDAVTMIAETDVDSLIDRVSSMEPDLLLVDSIQSLVHSGTGSAGGGIAQVRECASRLVAWSKHAQAPVIMTGHVTKDGSIAGPRVLEHEVDVVLHLEGDGLGPFRILRGIKNRFGSTNEVAVLDMSETGLNEVADPSGALLEERPVAAPGSLVTPTVEGSRPLLVEIQALVAPSAGSDARRTVTGVDINRVLLITAVLSRRLGLPLGRQDVIVNAIGGLRVTSPAADLAIALAIVSSLRDVPAGVDLAAVGEIGLTGEVRRVPQLSRRVAEAARLGFRRIIVPAASARERTDTPAGVSVIPVSTIREAVAEALSHEPVSSGNRRGRAS